MRIKHKFWCPERTSPYAKTRAWKQQPNKESTESNFTQRLRRNLVWKKADIDFASIVAEEIIRRSSGRRR